LHQLKESHLSETIYLDILPVAFKIS